MQTVLTTVGLTVLAGTLTLLLGGIVVAWSDHVRHRRSRGAPAAPGAPGSLLDRDLGAAVSEDHAHGVRRLTLVRRGGGQPDGDDGPWRARRALVERALDAALICAGYDDGTYTALVLRHTSGAAEHGRRYQCWRIPGPHADDVIARVERQLAEHPLGSQYCLRTDALLPEAPVMPR